MKSFSMAAIGPVVANHMKGVRTSNVKQKETTFFLFHTICQKCYKKRIFLTWKTLLLKREFCWKSFVCLSAVNTAVCSAQNDKKNILN
jgi:hypothetical protein